MYVEVFITRETGQERWFKVGITDGVADLSTVPDKLKNTWEKYGLPNGPGRTVRPEDGEKFLEAIARDFNGSMVRSENVRENEETLRNS